MTTKIPTSRAKTAYGLLSEIAALAIEEPKRMRMGDWRVRRATASVEPDLGFPACGTVGCIAGWAVTLRRVRLRFHESIFGGRYKEHEGDAAERLLGLTSEQSVALFKPQDLVKDPCQQTPEHARKVVAHIRRFQKAHRAQLLKTRITR